MFGFFSFKLKVAAPIKDCLEELDLGFVSCVPTPKADTLTDTDTDKAKVKATLVSVVSIHELCTYF